MYDLKVKTKSVCNVSRLPNSIFKDECPLTYIGKKIILGESLDIVWESFRSHYKDFNKINSLSDLFSIKSDDLDKVSTSSIFHPWIHEKPVSIYNDVWISIFENKSRFSISYEKMKKLIKSISKNGYDPRLSDDRQGGIVGYFLSSDDSVKWYVNAGNHRIAAIRCLGIKEFQCIFQHYSNMKQRDIQNSYLNYSGKSYSMRDYNTQNASCWPAVKSGFLDRTTAVKIANRYIYGY